MASSSRFTSPGEAIMQPPTCTHLRIRTVHDAHIMFHAVHLKIFPMVSRRLDTEERRALRSGNVYVWEERGRHHEPTGVSSPARHPASDTPD